MARPDARPRPGLRVPAESFLTGVAGCVALYALMKAITVFALPVGGYGKVTIGLVVFIGIGVVIGRLARRERNQQTTRTAAVGFGAALLGIAAGAVFWRFLEDYAFSRLGAYPIYQERRLFPFDIFLLWTFGSVPILCGIAAGVMMGRKTNN